jgi:tetratricopeptide (TPR) repeat protein
LRLQGGDVDDALEDIRTARELLPQWDRDTADLALETVLTAGLADEAEAWLKAIELAPEDAAAYRGWMRLVRGEVAESLGDLAKSPQEHRRVAQAQALALAEQRRFTEAAAWVSRATTFLPGRPQLEVATARVALHTGEPAAALKTLEALAAEHPWAPRVWTGVAEARVALEADEKDVIKALDRALAREWRPAEAAYLRAERAREGAQGEASQRKVLEHLELAAAAVPDLLRYRLALGTYLAQIGSLRHAKQTLEQAAEMPGAGAEAPLLLARLAVEDAVTQRKAPGKGARRWLIEAGRRGAAAEQLQREWARFELAEGTTESNAKALARLGPLISKEPKDVDLRALHVRALAKNGEDGDSRFSARAGVRRTRRTVDGPIYLAWALTESRTSWRHAAQLAFRGWSKMAADHPTGHELMVAAEQTSRFWLAIGQPNGARAVARDLTEAVPLSPEAWAFRARVQLKAGETEWACQSAEQARELDAKVKLEAGVVKRCAST